MSLDLSLRLPDNQTIANANISTGIFIRDNGATREVSIAEFERLNPGCEPITMIQESTTTSYVFDSNITHNLTTMAHECGLYTPLWDSDGSIGGQLIQSVTDGLMELQSKPEHYKTFNPANGWGDYGGLVSFAQSFLLACIAYPDAVVEVSR